MKIKFIANFLLIFLLLSCNKEDSDLWTEVHVKATDYNTGEVLSDVYIGIVEWNDKWLFDSKGKSISEGFTDANGEYHFEWKAKRGDGFSYEYAAQANPAKYKQVIFQQIDYLKKGDVHTYEIKLVEYGSFNLNLLNSNCENINDQFRFRYYFQHPYYSNYIHIYSPYWDNELYQEGCISQIGEAYHIIPAGNYKIEWNVTRDSGYSEGSDTFFVGNGDSLTYLLEY